MQLCISVGRFDWKYVTLIHSDEATGILLDLLTSALILPEFLMKFSFFFSVQVVIFVWSYLKMGYYIF